MDRREFLVTGISAAVLAAVGLHFLTGTDTKARTQEFDEAELTGRARPWLSRQGLRKQADEALKSLLGRAYKDQMTIRERNIYQDHAGAKEWWNRHANALKGQNAPYTAAIVAETLKANHIPGTNRRAFGTEIDLTLHPSKSMSMADAVAYMADNGFHLVYTPDPQRPGYPQNKRQFSYAPLAVPMLDALLRLDLTKTVRDLNVEGCRFFTPDLMKEYAKTYLLGINPALRPAKA